ncbi:hypothetical protein ACTJJ0_22795 [Chitinophaga sp. 22321]|uniref:Tetratricopeptide repeat-containing protein n=1 Tax=Chitinophaga hostae TaxID=2831022 RepID=A0ABS5JAM2_9BACT|nr:hypothetical protein [Chitinophaga hostae]MBS0031482.1 hypothetical protein [Chitinophaga hostae]
MTANRIIAHVFLQPSLHQVDEAVMERLVADHPYFSAARLLLAKKVYQQTGDLQSAAVKKALLYSNHQHYACLAITAVQQLQEVETRVAEVIPEDSLPEEPIAAADITESLVDEIDAATVLPEVEDRIPTVIPEDALPEDETRETATETNEPTAYITDQISAETMAAVAFEAVVAELSAEKAAAEIFENAPPLSFADFEPGPVIKAPTADMPLPPVVPAPAESIMAANDSGDSEDGEANAGPIKIFPLGINLEVEETELIFQPLYTDDYFAYKRLKNPEEADDLNEQGAAEMKSFTSWLRQMKDNFVGKTSKDWYHQQLHKIYEEDDEPEVSETVEKMAMDSIVFNNDIVSETLAEIWVRQHQYANAIKIYQKLSLLNPDKNAYFAQKILELKSQTEKK